MKLSAALENSSKMGCQAHLSDLVHSDDYSLTTLKFRLKNEIFCRFYYFANIWTRININALNHIQRTTDSNGNNFQISNSSRPRFSTFIRFYCDCEDNVIESSFIYSLNLWKDNGKFMYFAKLKRIPNWSSFLLSKQLQKIPIFYFKTSNSATFRTFKHFVKQYYKLQEYTSNKKNSMIIISIEFQFLLASHFALKLKHIKSVDPNWME